jgi:hypothetical protein
MLIIHQQQISKHKEDAKDLNSLAVKPPAYLFGAEAAAKKDWRPQSFLPDDFKLPNLQGFQTATTATATTTTAAAAAAAGDTESGHASKKRRRPAKSSASNDLEQSPKRPRKQLRAKVCC